MDSKISITVPPTFTPEYLYGAGGDTIRRKLYSTYELVFVTTHMGS